MIFKSGSEMLEALKTNDLYNTETGEYVFSYNEAGAVCVYVLNKSEAKEIAKKSQEDDEYWGAYLGPGGSIYDPEEVGMRSYSNEDYCRDAAKRGNWIYTSDYNFLKEE
jgi:hypothetical protein